MALEQEPRASQEEFEEGSRIKLLWAPAPPVQEKQTRFGHPALGQALGPWYLSSPDASALHLEELSPHFLLSFFYFHTASGENL